jgi:hypothetical protein
LDHLGFVRFFAGQRDGGRRYDRPVNVSDGTLNAGLELSLSRNRSAQQEYKRTENTNDKSSK